MAVTAEKSAEYTDYSATPVKNIPVHKWGGRLRARYFKFTQGAAAGDANSTADLVRMPGGNVRVIGHLSKIHFAAFGAARTLDLGHRAYTKQDGTTQAAAEDFFASAVDVSAAGNAAFDEAGAAGVHGSPLITSRDGFDIYAKVEGGTIPNGTVLEGVIVYIVD